MTDDRNKIYPDVHQPRVSIFNALPLGSLSRREVRLKIPLGDNAQRFSIVYTSSDARNPQPASDPTEMKHIIFITACVLLFLAATGAEAAKTEDDLPDPMPPTKSPEQRKKHHRKVRAPVNTDSNHTR
ncbi:hypothetical protein V5799_003688 [Amblyomma americanum]|uniref:Uncharacterized protein n=1 Tax=Amblyomma americanum TaxID=6943 RepID=A0AAQ4D890_AMBAM